MWVSVSVNQFGQLHELRSLGSTLPAGAYDDQDAGSGADSGCSMAGPSDDAAADTGDAAGDVPFVFELPAKPDAAPKRTIRPVPDVHGLMLRDAVRSLHRAGFRVQLARGTGVTTATSPAAGALAPTGTLVRLLFDH